MKQISPSSLSKYLPEKLTLKNQGNWMVTKSISESDIAAIACHINDFTSIAAENLCKQKDRRLIFRHRLINNRSVIVKAFPLTHLRHQIKHRKYGTAEACNLLLARDKGLPVPEVCAYGDMRRLGLVQWNAVLMEELSQGSLLEQLQKMHDEAQWNNILDKLIPLFKLLYTSRCFHLDLKADDLLVTNTNHFHYAMIDFQYVCYLPKPSTRAFALMVGHFGWDCCQLYQVIPKSLFRAWYTRLLIELGLEVDNEAQELFEKSFSQQIRRKQKLKLLMM